MPVTPYAKLLVSVNGGAPSRGLFIVNQGDIIQFTGENTSGWKTQRWEIYSYPTAWGTPSGWSRDSVSEIIYSIAVIPPPITIPNRASLWGKYLPRLTVNSGQLLLPNGEVIQDLNLVDEVSALSQLSVNNLEGVGYAETNQASTARGWQAALDKSLRALDAKLGTVIDITSYGAALDDSTDDTAAWNAAFAAIAGAGGGQIIFPRGISKITATLFPPSNCDILGVGPNSSRFHQVTDYTTAIQFESVLHVGLRNLGVDNGGSNGAKGGDAIRFSKNTALAGQLGYFDFTNVTVFQYGKGALVGAQTGAAATFGAPVGRVVTVTGLTGMSSGSIGHYLRTTTGAAHSQNTGEYIILAYHSANSVDIHCPSGVAEAATVTWSERYPLAGFNFDNTHDDILYGAMVNCRVDVGNTATAANENRRAFRACGSMLYMGALGCLFNYAGTGIHAGPGMTNCGFVACSFNAMQRTDYRGKAVHYDRCSQITVAEALFEAPAIDIVFHFTELSFSNRCQGIMGGPTLVANDAAIVGVGYYAIRENDGNTHIGSDGSNGTADHYGDPFEFAAPTRFSAWVNFKRTTVTLANGTNDNVTPSPGKGGLVEINGPSAAFTITGLKSDGGFGGGGLVFLENPTGQDMTVAHESGNSTAGYRFHTASGTDAVFSGGTRIVPVLFNSTIARWVLVSNPDTADSYEAISNYLALGTSVATTGTLRVGNSFTFYGKNSSATNAEVLHFDGSDNLHVGDATAWGSVELDSINGVVVPSGSFSIGSSPASTGTYRVNNSFSFYGKNSSATNAKIVSIDGSDNLHIGDSAAWGHVVIDAISGLSATIASFGSAVASTGILRTGNAFTVYTKNSATIDSSILSIDGGDSLIIGDATNLQRVTLLGAQGATASIFSVGSSVASTGVLRTGNAFTIYTKNSATTNSSVLSIDGGDSLILGDATNLQRVTLLGVQGATASRLDLGSSVAGAGVLRTGNAFSLYSKNSSAVDAKVVSLAGSSAVHFGDATNWTTLYLDASNGVLIPTASLSLGGTVAGAGTFRTANSFTMKTKNSANTDSSILSIDGGDSLILGDATNLQRVTLLGAQGVTAARFDLGSSVASTGVLRTGNAFTVYTKNSANTNSAILSIDGGDSLILGDATNLQRVTLLGAQGVTAARLDIGSSPASTGTFRTGNAFTMYTKNSANTNSSIMSIDGGDSLIIGDATNLQRVTLLGVQGVIIASDLKHTGSKVGFNGSTPVTIPTVTGSRTTGAALASLLTALASEGLIIDGSSA